VLEPTTYRTALKCSNPRYTALESNTLPTSARTHDIPRVEHANHYITDDVWDYVYSIQLKQNVQKHILPRQTDKIITNICFCANCIGYLRHIHNVNISMVAFLYTIQADVSISVLIRFIRYVYYAQFLNSLSYEN
jgi:hypothetical protein